MEKTQVTGRQFVKARKDPTKMLNLVDETFDQMALTVQPSVVVAGQLGALVRRNDDNRPALNNPIDQGLSGIAAIRNHVLSQQSFQQGVRLRTFVRLPGGQPYPQWIAQPVYREMDFGAETSATTTQRLRLLPATFFVRQRRTDGRALLWRPPVRFPYLDRWQSAQTSVPTRPPHTTARNACRRCSSFHIRSAISATALRSAVSKEQLRQNADTCVPTRPLPAGKSAGRFGFSSILRLVVLQFS